MRAKLTEVWKQRGGDGLVVRRCRRLYRAGKRCDELVNVKKLMSEVVTVIEGSPKMWP